MKLVWFINLKGELVVPTFNMLVSALEEFQTCRFLVVSDEIASIQDFEKIDIDQAENIFVDPLTDPSYSSQGRIVVCRSHKVLGRALRNDSVVVNTVADKLTTIPQSASQVAYGVVIICEDPLQHEKVFIERNQAKLPSVFNVYTFKHNQLKQVTL